jgi:hypothetical protein
MSPNTCRQRRQGSISRPRTCSTNSCRQPTMPSILGVWCSLQQGRCAPRLPDASWRMRGLVPCVMAWGWAAVVAGCWAIIQT